jgi:AhpD family alkylhydroperoxidase
VIKFVQEYIIWIEVVQDNIASILAECNHNQAEKGACMETRLNYAKVAPKAFQAMYQLESYVRNCGLEASLLELVKIRASQINGCAFCLDMHTKDARAAGESEQRIYLLSAWREAPFYSERERAALEWTEAITLIADNHVPDEIYESVKAHFSEEELVNLTLAINTINSWNRLSIAFRALPGTYQPAHKH